MLQGRMLMARWCHSPRLRILPRVKVSKLLPLVMESRSSCSSGLRLCVTGAKCDHN